ncbi:hypothetical protein B7463_g9999, partial [Scytalidium lignicola]
MEAGSMHILLVEDNVVNQRLITKLLQKFGCTVSTANNGQEALDYLSSPPSISNPRPVMIFMDVSMPVMTGYEATKIIRTQPPFCTDSQILATPIIGMPIQHIIGDKAKCLEVGMNDVITKPIYPRILKQTLLRWSRWQVLQGGPGSLSQYSRVPAWGPIPLRAYRGPRSLL